jgi:cAMP-specific phosphodiesterase 4
MARVSPTELSPTEPEQRDTQSGADTLSPNWNGSLRNSWRLTTNSRASRTAQRRPLTLISRISGRPSGGDAGLLRIVAEPQATGNGKRSSSQRRQQGSSMTQRWYRSTMTVLCRRFIRSKAFSFVTMVCLFAALFLYDTFILLQVPSNTELDVALTLVLVVFLFEFFGLTLTEREYPGGFFFWMDLIGTLSMLFDISYLLGPDATRPEQVRESSAKDNVVLVRAARTARLGARAGRLTRVLKLLRFMPCLYVPEDGGGNVKVAHSITGRLNTVLAQRVAFLTICIVVTMPIFNMFGYPENDGSFTSWAKLLARNVGEVMANQSSTELMTSELQRFSNFYIDLYYGPYEVCYGVPVGDGFVCKPELLPLTFSSSFEKPVRRASMREVSVSNFQASYDMSVVTTHESAANMASIILVITVMLGFGLLMSNSISVVVLTPLERMLSVVRGHCKQIFKFAAGIQEDVQAEDEGQADDNEFQLLEDVIAKLTAIASLSTKKSEPRITKDMKEEDLIQLNWMQGATRVQPSVISAARSSNVVSPHDLDEKTLAGSDAHESPDGETPSRRSKQLSPTGIVDSVPSQVLASLDSADCNVLDWGKEMQLGVCGYIIRCKGSHADWVSVNVDHQTLSEFISAVEQGYLPNPFHNFSHGVDVLYSVSRFLQLIDAGEFLTEVSQYLLLVAALAHDVGHIGVNNQFLMDTSHELAIKYNDRSPMEMMHCSKLFHIVRNPSCDIFKTVDKDQYQYMRKVIIDGILHTDMTHHVSMIKDLVLLYQMSSDAFDRLTPGSVVSESPQTTQTVLNALLHCADISNPMRPWELCHRFADMVLDEFFAQGDKERELGVPVQFLNDRTKVNRPNSQVGFIEFVIAPMCEACVHLFPQLNGLAGNLASNISRWSDLWQAESSPEQAEVDKVTARVQKVVLRCEDLRHNARYSIS